MTNGEVLQRETKCLSTKRNKTGQHLAFLRKALGAGVDHSLNKESTVLHWSEK